MSFTLGCMAENNKKLVSLFTVLLLVASVLVIGSTSPVAAADGVEDSPERSWDLINAVESNHTGAIEAIVWDLQEYQGKMYVGGKFQNVVSPNRNQQYDQAFLAAFDLRTGQWDQSFRPSLDGPVYAIDVRSDGKLIVGGELTGGMAAVDPTSGAVDTSFNPQIRNNWGNPAVYDLEIVGNNVYAGGAFAVAQGVDVDRLGKFNVYSGAVNPNWTPTTQFDYVTPRSGGETVYGLAVDAARDRVYVVGKFGGINNNTDAAYFAILNTSNGELKNNLPQGLPPNIINHREGWSMWQHDVQFRGDEVYVGGQAHQTLVLDADTLQADNSWFTNRGVDDEWRGGDTQVLFVGKNTLWSGCHCWGSVGPYGIGSYNGANPSGHQTIEEYRSFQDAFRTTNPFGQQKVRGLYGVDLDTKDLLPITFDLAGAAGAWALYEDSLGQLWVGGEFTRGGGITLNGLARFAPVDGLPGPGIPTPPVTTPPVTTPPTTNPPPTTPVAPVDNCRRGPVPAQFDVSTSANASIYRLYCAYFLRMPDVEGFNYWVSTYNQGVSLSDIAYFFQAGQEFNIRHASKTNAQFVDWTYANVMERPSDAVGRAYWLRLLDSGSITRSGVVFYFSESAEFKIKTQTQ